MGLKATEAFTGGMLEVLRENLRVICTSAWLITHTGRGADGLLISVPFLEHEIKLEVENVHQENSLVFNL